MSSPEPGPLFIVGNFDGKGGLQWQMEDLSLRFAETSLVTIITWTTRDNVGIERQGNRWIVRVRALERWDRDLPPWRARANTAVSITTAVAAALRMRERWSSVYSAGINPEGIVATLAARSLRRPAIIGTWLSGPLGNVARFQRSKAAPLMRRVLRSARAFPAENSQIERELLAAGIPRDRIHPFSWGASPTHLVPRSSGERSAAREKLGLRQDDGVVAYNGRFDVRQKRVDLLLDAWRNAHLKGWRLVCAGDGPDRHMLEQRAAGIEPPVLFTGWLDNVRELLCAADAFVLPTTSEGTGLSMLEGMSYGIPGIVSSIELYREWAPAGVTLCDNDVESWTRALIALSQDASGRHADGESARAWVKENRDPSRTFASFERLLRPRSEADGER